MKSINTKNKIISPIEFRDYVEYNGKTYLEITDREVPNISPGKYYMATDGEIYTKNKGGGIKKHTSDSRYFRNSVVLKDNTIKGITEHNVLMRLYCNQPNIDSDNLEVNHIDGNKYNNNLSNLEWVTHKENIHHAYENKLNQNYCENNPSSYLSNDTVREIVRRLKNREYTSFVDLAKEYGCSEVLIVRISTGRAWRRISEDEGLTYFKTNKRFSDEEVHNMCKLFVRYKHLDFDLIRDIVIRELGLDSDSNTKRKIRNIYYKRDHYFTRISNQYDY